MLTSFLVLFVPLQAELNIKRIEKMVERIQNKRVSTRKVDFIKVPSPFVVVVPRDQNHSRPKMKAPKKSVKFLLGAIVGEKAFINGSWVEKGDRMMGYLIMEIKPEEVILKKDSRVIHLFLPIHKKKNLLQLSEG